MPAHPELGFYTLAGAPKSPRELIDEVREAEALGLGAAFISERFNIKEACTLSGAAGAVSDDLRIITGATNHNTRHPMVTAVLRDDHALPDRRPVHARHRPGHRRCCRTPTACPASPPRRWRTSPG